MVFVSSVLLLETAAALGKFLLKQYVNEFAEAVGGGFLDLAKDRVEERIKDARDARKARRQYEAIGDELVQRLESDLHSAILGHEDPRPDPEKIFRRLLGALEGKISSEFVVHNQIDPQKLADAIRSADAFRAELLTPAEQRLFDEMASRAAQYLFRVSSKLPHFDERRAEESVATLAQLANEVTEVLDDARAIREAVVARPLTDEIGYEASYRNAVVAEMDKVELFGVDLPPELQEARLTDAYVTLRLRQDNQADEDEAEVEQDNSEQPITLTAEQAFDRLRPGSGRLLIRGGAGCGKTTLVRWAAIQAARGTSSEHRVRPEFERTAEGDIRLLHEDEQAAFAASWRRKMPFVITLRNCPDGKFPPPELFPTQIGNEVGNPTPFWTSRLLQQGHAIVLIDGIDEVPKLNHKELYDSVKRLCDTFPSNYYVLTSRPDAITSVRFEDLGFESSEIERLEDNDRKLFIEHWFKAVAVKQKLPASKVGELQAEASELNNLINQTPWLSQLATTPLYCAMTCALYRDRRRAIPQSLRAMCETLCEMTIDRRDRERKLPLDKFPAAYSQLDYQQKKLILQRLAHFFVLAGKSSISETDAIFQVAKALAGMLHRTSNDAKVVFDVLMARSGMMRYATPATSDRPATVQFVHNTFKEFLAGEQLADEANASFLVARLTDETWRRVGLFAIAAGNAKYQNDVIREWLQSIPNPLPKKRKKKSLTDDEAANTPRGRAIYALRCGLLGNEWDDDVKTRLSQLNKDLLPPHSVAEAEWLATAGNEVVPYLDVNPNRLGYIITACVRALRLIGTPDAMQVIEKYKGDFRANIIAELLHVYRPPQLDQFLYYLTKRRWMPNIIASNIHSLRDFAITSDAPFLSLHSVSLDDYSELKAFTSLETLDLGWSTILDLTPIASLVKLRALYLDSTAIIDLSPLNALPSLASLSIRRTSVADLSPLCNLPKLNYLDVTGVKSDKTPLLNLIKRGVFVMGL